MTFVYCVLIWPIDTLCWLFLWTWATEQLSKHRQEAIAMLLAFVLAMIPTAIVMGIMYACHVNEFIQLISYFVVFLYALSVVIDEERQRPYIWLWQKCKRLFKKKNYHIHIG